MADTVYVVIGLGGTSEFPTKGEAVEFAREEASTAAQLGYTKVAWPLIRVQ